MVDPFSQPVSDPTHFPVDENLERGLLGAILLEPSVMDQLEQVQPKDFYFSSHQQIFRRMQELWNAGSMIDPVMVSDRDPELISICNDAYASCPSALMAATYARKLKDLSLKRQMLPFLERAADMSMNGAAYEDVLDYMRKELDSDERRNIHDTWQVRRAADLVDPPAAREWLLDGLIFRGQVSMWFGPPGIKKTLLLMDMCAAMATGQNWLVRRHNQEEHTSLTTFHSTGKKRVLWLDYDNGEFETEIRIRAALTARDGLANADFYYMSETIPWLALDNASHVQRVIRLALQVGADVIVFDALGMVLGDVDENAPDVARVISKLKEIRAATGAAIIAVHHPSKSGAQNDKASTYNAAGSAKFSNFFEWSVELRPGDEKGTIVASVVKHRGWAKTNKFAAELHYTHWGNEQPELAHELKTFKFYPYSQESAGEKREQAMSECILSQLVAGEMNQKELAASVKAELESSTGKTWGEASIKEHIKAMAKAGEIVGRQKAERQPVLYSLPSVDPVDHR